MNKAAYIIIAITAVAYLLLYFFRADQPVQKPGDDQRLQSEPEQTPKKDQK